MHNTGKNMRQDTGGGREMKSDHWLILRFRKRTCKRVELRNIRDYLVPSAGTS